MDLHVSSATNQTPLAGPLLQAERAHPGRAPTFERVWLAANEACRWWVVRFFHVAQEAAAQDSVRPWGSVWFSSSGGREDVPGGDALRSPRRHRPRIRRILPPPGDIDLCELAKRVRYVGSVEHKDHPSFAGAPRLRSDASLCDPALAKTQRTLTQWLRKAVRAAQIGGPWEGDFPRYVWYRWEGIVYEGRLVNRGGGEYKGYPLLREEWPDGLE